MTENRALQTIIKESVMKKNTFSIAVAIIAFAFIFIACGGEEPNLPDDDQDNDEIVVVDDEPDNEQPDDIVDEEPVDDDQLPLEEVCKNFLDYAGDWSMIEVADGDATITLSVEGSICKISVTGKWTFEWRGTETPLECAEFAPASYFFYLAGKNEDGKMIWYRGFDAEGCKSEETSVIILLEKK